MESPAHSVGHFHEGGALRAERAPVARLAQPLQNLSGDAPREYSKSCPRHGVLTAKQVESELIKRMKRIHLPDAWGERIAQLATATPEHSQREEKRRLLNSQLERLQKLFVQGDMSKEEYDKRKKRIQGELEKILSLDSDLQERVKKTPDKLGIYLRLATESERKHIVHLLFRRVSVGKEVERAVPRKPFVHWLASAASAPSPGNADTNFVDACTAR